MKTPALLLQLCAVILCLIAFNFILKKSFTAPSKEDTTPQETPNIHITPKPTENILFNELDFTSKPVIEPTRAISYSMQENNYNLGKVDEWMNYLVFKNSINQYGLAVDDIPLLDIPYGLDPTHADTISYIAGRYFPGPKTYLEVGVSVGKTFYQMMNAFSTSVIFGYELENINPVLEKYLSEKEEISSWATIFNSSRKTYSTSTRYKCAESQSEVYYVAADINDVDSWNSLRARRFDVILLNGPPSTITMETQMLLSMNILSYDRLLMWYGLDNQEAISSFIENTNKLKAERLRWLQKENVAIVQARDTLDNLRFYGIISTLNISKIISEDVTLH